jgi:RecA-family ATPase
MSENRTFTRRYDSFPPSRVKWLWKPYIPLGKVSVIQGDPGDGKTTLALSLAAMLTTGRPLPETDGEPLLAEVIYQSAEDNVSDTLNPRLTALGADCSKISAIDVPFSDIEKDCETLENAIREVGAKLCVLDPLCIAIHNGSYGWKVKMESSHPRAP